MKENMLRHKIAVGGFALVLVMVVVTGFHSAAKPDNAVIEIAARQSAQIARSISHKVEVTLAKQANLASTIAGEKSVMDAADKVKLAGAAAAGWEIEAANAYLEQVMTNSSGNYEGLSLLNANGGVITGVQGGLDPGSNPFAREAFDTARTGKVGIGSPVKSEETGSVVVHICAPILNARGEFVGGISAAVNIGFLLERINNTRFGETGYAFMVDKKGKVIGHPGQDLMPSMNLTAEKETKNVGQGMISQKTGMESYTYRGEKRHVGFTPVELAGWSVGFTRNSAEMVTSSRLIGYTLGFMGMILLCLTMGTSLLPHLRRMTFHADPVVAGLREGIKHATSAAFRIY